MLRTNQTGVDIDSGSAHDVVMVPHGCGQLVVGIVVYLIFSVEQPSIRISIALPSNVGAMKVYHSSIIRDDVLHGR